MATFTFGFTQDSNPGLLSQRPALVWPLPFNTTSPDIFFSMTFTPKITWEKCNADGALPSDNTQNELRHRRAIHIPFGEARLQTQPDCLSKVSLSLIPVFKALKQSEVYILAMNRRKGWLYKHEKVLSGDMFIYSFSVHLRAVVLCPSSRPEDKLSSHSLLLCHHSWPSFNHCHNKIKLHCLLQSHLPLAIFCFKPSHHWDYLFTYCYASKTPHNTRNHRQKLLLLELYFEVHWCNIT